MKKVEVFHMKKSEMRPKKTWIFRILQLPINKMKYWPQLLSKNLENNLRKRMKDDQYMLILSIYVSFMFQDFEIFLRTEIDLFEDDIRLVLDEYNSSFIAYDLQLDIYTFKYLFEAFFNILQPEYDLFSNSVVIELDDITMKTKLIVRSGIISNKIDEKFLVLSLDSTTVGIINTIMNTLFRKS